MAVVTGVRDTNTTLAAKLKIDMSEKIALLQPSAAPLITFLKRAKGNTLTANNPKFSWLEDNLGARWDAIDAADGILANATRIVVDNGAYFSVGDVVKVPRTGECLLVSAVDPDNDNPDELTVVRAFGTTSAAAIENDDPLVIIGNANEEGSGVRTIKSVDEVEVYNYTQFGCAA